MSNSFNFSGLLSWKPNQGSDWILGNGFLARKQAVLISADAGVGKSNFAQHLSYSMVLGREFLGFKPSRPLRVLYVQNENSSDDLAESAKGFAADTCLKKADIQRLDTNYLAVTLLDCTGQGFKEWLRTELPKFYPDVLVLDPLFAYMGCDAAEQKAVTDFLRNQMAPILRDYNCGWICVHHNKKDRRDSGSGPKAFGSVEIAAYFRGIIELRAKSPAELEMEISKRHRQANLGDENGNLVSRRLLQLGTDRISWKLSSIVPKAPQIPAIAAPARAPGRPAKASKDDVNAYITELRRQKKPDNEIVRMVAKEFKYSTKQARRLVSG